MKNEELVDKLGDIILIGGKYWFLSSLFAIVLQGILGIIFQESGFLLHSLTGTLFLSSLCLICLGAISTYGICISDSIFGPHTDAQVFISGLFTIAGGIWFMYESASAAYWILHFTPQIPGWIGSFFHHAFTSFKASPFD